MSVSTSRAKITAIMIAILGVLAATILIAYFNVGAVLGAMARVGWGGFLIAIGCQLILFVPLGLAWLAVTPDEPFRRLDLFVWGRLMREAASDVLPFSQLGGFVASARVMALGGLSGAAAFGSGVVDVTFEMFAQLAYTLIGVCLLVARLGSASRSDHLVWLLVLGIAGAAVMAVSFMFVQRKGVALAERIAQHVLPAAAAHAAGVGRVIESAYRRPLRLWMSLALHLLCWFGSALGTWIVLHLIGKPLPFTAVVAIESLLYAIRNAAFVVPSGLGVQEGAYALLGPLFGLPPETALALSLLKRARDIVIGVPALIVWQMLESRRRGMATGQA